MKLELPIHKNFGNYSVRGIDEIAPPELVSWLPATTAWAILCAALFAAAILMAAKRYQHWTSNAYRRQALQRLRIIDSASRTNTSALQELPVLMKATALRAFPRTQAAALSGEAWLNFLSDSYRGPSFKNEPGQALLRLAYQSKEQTLEVDTAKALIDQCEIWLAQHHEFVNKEHD